MTNKKLITLFLCAAILVSALTGCSAIGAYFSQLRGELFGNDYTIRQYDDFGNLVFTIHGDRVTMDCELDEDGEITSYIDITIDGHRMKMLQGKAMLNKSASWKNTLYREVGKQHESVNISLIPYYAWGNRQKCDMTVWMPVAFR